MAIFHLIFISYLRFFIIILKSKNYQLDSLTSIFASMNSILKMIFSKYELLIPMM